MNDKVKATAHTKAQKARILAAAQACFVESGFHAASMATIAETAGISPGLIYRYFDSKNAIILAIIEQQLKTARCRIRQLHASNDLAARIVSYFDENEAECDNLMSTALYLEMSAEATRDPQIAAVLRRFDVAVCSELAGWLSRSRQDGGYGLPDKITPAWAMILLCLIEGLKARGARDLEFDRLPLKEALDEIIASLAASPASLIR